MSCCLISGCSCIAGLAEADATSCETPVVEYLKYYCFANLCVNIQIETNTYFISISYRHASIFIFSNLYSLKINERINVLIHWFQVLSTLLCNYCKNYIYKIKPNYGA
jgi:hypothetical protein